MKFSSFSLVAALASAALLSACTTSPQVNSSVLSAATSRGVAQSTSDKMSAARPLAYSDLENLVARGVPSASIIAYLNSVRETPDFSPAQLDALQQAGADPQLTAFLRESGNFALRSPASSRSQASRSPAGQNTNSPGYQDEQPFAYNEPAIDGFYDSGYEESLYSPFSFN